jgi:hypothetical protein
VKLEGIGNDDHQRVFEVLSIEPGDIAEPNDRLREALSHLKGITISEDEVRAQAHRQFVTQRPRRFRA